MSSAGFPRATRGVLTEGCGPGGGNGPHHLPCMLECQLQSYASQGRDLWSGFWAPKLDGGSLGVYIGPHGHEGCGQIAVILTIGGRLWQRQSIFEEMQFCYFR